jgi:hypothetical protein
MEVGARFSRCEFGDVESVFLFSVWGDSHLRIIGNGAVELALRACVRADDYSHVYRLLR